MGISGLLPLLKSIQTTKHLSDFAGQTLAVDAYVWLHRGVFSCATEIATGRKTHKYVDYAMHRVRLLRHFNITPYIVFDGGPLPAKKGTEVERKKRREENLARGNALAEQGKHSQAREFYVKCVDVTPQMAFQLIKVLRAENVPYVVAPYEADAQLAFLERTGLVNGIITEDSDLLVFGCQTVLFKLDDVNNTITCISRADFASVAPTASDPGGISLIGWSDTQFRHMAILSGCDYLPSIPGIGLKTASALLKKWRTADNVVRTLRLEGKKSVPKDYMKNFRLAERCFLHQRVYDPRTERLVFLSEVGDDWDLESDAYVGDDIDPLLAKKIALGDVDPATLLPMTDINVDFVPRVLKHAPLHSSDTNRPDKGKGKADKGKGKAKCDMTPKASGILSFFGPNAIIPTSSKPLSARPITVNANMKVGSGSGKRTLVEVMDHEMISKKAKRDDKPKSPVGISKFFGPAPTPSSSRTRGPTRSISLPESGPSRVARDKENEVIVLSDDSDLEVLSSDCDFSTVAQGKVDSDMMFDVADPEPQVVTQEDGYISPEPDSADEGDAPDFSSPVYPQRTQRRPQASIASPEFGVDPVSSPPNASGSRNILRRRHSELPLFVAEYRRAQGTTTTLGPDLRSTFTGDASSDIDCFDDDNRQGVRRRVSGSTEPPSPSPQTPPELGYVDVPGKSDVQLVDIEEIELQAHRLRTEAVANGWRERWALGAPAVAGTRAVDTGSVTPKPITRRRETTITKAGRHTPLVTRPRTSAPTVMTARKEPRRSLNFVQQDKSRGPATRNSGVEVDVDRFLDDKDLMSKSLKRTGALRRTGSNERFVQFRWTGS